MDIGILIAACLGLVILCVVFIASREEAEAEDKKRHHDECARLDRKDRERWAKRNWKGEP